MVDPDYQLIRPEDHFVGLLTLSNLVVDQGRTHLVRVSAGEAAAVVLELPTQHFAEPAIDANVTPWIPEVVPLFAGKRSRLEFMAPDGVDSFDLGESGILGVIGDWALSPGGSWVDVLSTLWVHAPDQLKLREHPMPTDGRGPLWSARAELPPRETIDLKWWSQWPIPGPMYDGWQDLSNGLVLRPPFSPHNPWRCSKMLLTPLGGTMSIDGPLLPDDARPAFGQTYRTSLGRDAYARHVTTGHLSSGHRASLVTVSRRDLAPVQAGDPAQGGHEGGWTVLATLVMTTTLVVTEEYVDLRSEVSGSNAFVGLTLAAGERRVDSTNVGLSWITDQGMPVSFDLVATDHAGGQVDVRMPLAFIPEGVPGLEAQAFVAAGGVAATQMRTQAVAVAPAAGSETTVTVAAVETSSSVATNRPIVPTVRQMTVVVDQLAGLMDAPPVADFRFHDLYEQSGLDPGANPQGAFLQILAPDGSPGQQLDVPLSPQTMGAVGNPGLKVGALTAQAGAVAGDLVKQAVPSLDEIKAAFPSAKLFGTINLLDLLGNDPFGRDGGRVKLPAVTHRRTPTGEEFAYTFEANLHPGNHNGTIVGNGAALTLTSTVERRSDGQVVATSRGKVTHIGFDLAGAITLTFAEVTFSSSGGHTDFGVAGTDLQFGKELEFVAEIAEKLKSLGQGSGVRVDVDSNGVTAGFGLAIPSVSLMAMQFSNLTVDAWLRLPFTGAPMAFTLDIANRERPFLVTVAMFGGGGWFALEVSPQGVRRIEVGIEFGGSLSLDIIVASGGVSVMAGIYIGWNAAQGTTSFRAYLRASGHVSVLGIITVFVEFVLELRYEKAPLEAGGRNFAIFAGRASVTVGVEVLFFSKSVTLTVERRFVGSEADPTFLDCFDHDDWDEYCDAYAPDTAIGER